MDMAEAKAKLDTVLDELAAAESPELDALR